MVSQVSAIAVVLTYLGIKPFSAPPAETIAQQTPEQTNEPSKSETSNQSTQDSTPTKPLAIPTPRVDWENAILAKTLTGHSTWVGSVAIGPDGKTLASGSYRTIKIWSLETRREIATLTGDSSHVSSVAIGPDGKTLASASYKTIKIWSLETRREIATLEGHSSWVKSVAIGPDGKTLASGSWDNTIKIWQVGLSK